MSSQTLEIKVAIQISKPADVVFEAIVDPSKMSNYFIAKGTGRIEEGKDVIWQFPEFDDQVPVKGSKIENNRYVSFYWEGAKDKNLLVEMTLNEKSGNATMVSVIEKEMENDETGIKWLKSNTEGWANFLACLKAYLEYGINLRNGAFDFMRK